MSDSKITLFSFAKWMEDNDDDLFSNLTLPDGIDSDTLTGNIILRGGEFEVVYSDPYFLQKAISIWSSKWYRTFEKWVAALAIEYDPLYNYDRTESYTDITDKDSSNTRTLDNSDKRTLNNTDERTLDNTDKRTLDTTNNSETTVSAYDSSDYQPSNNVETTDDGTITDAHTGTVTDAHTGTVTDAHSGTIGDVYADDETFTHNSRTYGNIGVTTSQQMLESELDVAKWNLYEHITDIFLEEFVIPIYD